MAFVEWDEKYSVGNEEIDRQHKKLFEIINGLFEGIKKREGKESLQKALQSLIEYTQDHFATEESYFEKTNYPDTERHKQIHKELVEKVGKIGKEIEKGTAGISIEFLDFLVSWLQNHILLTDKKFAPFLKK